MKNYLKILLYIFAFCLFTFAFVLPEIILGTPASPAVGNWYQQFMPNTNGASIRDITFTDNFNGFIVTSIGGSNSYILKTTNSGDNWIVKFNHIDPFVRVKFINNNTGFTNAFQTIFKTTNAGENWSPINLPGIFGDDMFILNNDSIWLAMSASLGGGVFFTSNGGANWVQQYSAGSQNPEKIYMYNARIGFISDNSGASSIRKTTNGGLNWNMNVNGEWFKEMFFVDSLTGWRTRGDTMKFTSDGGINWINQVMPYGGMIFTSNMTRFSVLNKDTIWGSGGYLLFPNNRVKSILFRTTNGGNNWLFQLPDTSLLPFEQFVKFTDKLHGWYYSTNYSGIHTTSGGDPLWLTAVEQTSTEIPKEFNLYQNYPNPFNPETKIKFQLLKQANTEITIYDITGRKVQQLLNEELIAGEYVIDFNATGLSSGTYFYKIIINSGKEVFTDTKKMILVK